MKFCSTCGAQLEDNAQFCPQCGTNFAPAAPAVVIDPADHTAEFDPQDISENKVVAMLPYLCGLIGVIIAAILAADSPFARFHVKTALKFTVCQVICCIAFIIPILGWIAGGIALAIIFVLEIIAFFQVCGGKAKEPAIIKGLGFLK